MAEEQPQKPKRKPVQRKAIQKQIEAKVRKRPYVPTGNPIGRPKVSPEAAKVIEGVRPSHQPAAQQGRHLRAKIAAVGLDPKSIVPKEGVVGNPTKLSEIASVQPLEVADLDSRHDHDWTTVQSMTARDRRTPVTIANKLNAQDNRGERRFNFRVVSPSRNSWHVQRQAAFCKDCSPYNPNATEKPPTSPIA